MPLPLAYLLTWTTYGTWLHGDPRGSVDSDHCTVGDAYAPASAGRMRSNAQRMKQGAYRLDAAARRIVRDAIVEHCAFRGWELVALQVRSNHVHLVVRTGEVAPEDATRKFKARATRMLHESGVIAADRLVWTERGSGRYLWADADVQAAVRYVMDAQGVDLD